MASNVNPDLFSTNAPTLADLRATFATVKSELDWLQAAPTLAGLEVAGTAYFGGVAGAESLRVVPVANAVDYLQVNGAATAGVPSLAVNGSDANPGLILQTKGIGSWYFKADAGANTQFQVSPTASAVNYPQVRGGATGGNGAIIGTVGSDADAWTQIHSRGTGAVYLATGGGSVNQCVVAHAASAVNYPQLTGAAAGGVPYWSSQGSDANVRARVTTKGTGQFDVQTGGAAGPVPFTVTHTASSVNGWTLHGGATGGHPGIRVSGSDANVNADLFTLGSGSHRLRTNGSEVQFVAAHNASAVNCAQVTGGAAANAGVPWLYWQGSDADVYGNYISKGAGWHSFATGGSSTNRQLIVAHTANAVDYVQVTGHASSFPGVTATGASATVHFVHGNKGSANHHFATSVSSTTQFLVAHTASAMNYPQVTGAATGASPIISEQGADASQNIALIGKGAGGTALGNTQQNIVIFAYGPASGVNYAQVNGAVTGGIPTISAQGSDANVGLKLAPKGSEYLWFGTHSAIAAEVITGYITIKDAGGTLRKLAVIA